MPTGRRCEIVPAPAIEAIYGNPGFQGMMYTAGSNAVTSYYTPLRIFGAQVRRVLIDNAAKKLGVPVEELTTEPSVVVHAKSGRKLSYGEIAAFAEVPAKAPEIKPEQLKKPSEFRLIGKDVMRVELPGKVNGSARYASTCRFRTCSTAPSCGHRWKARCRTRSTTAKAKAIAGVGPDRPACPMASACSPRPPGRRSRRARRSTDRVTWSTDRHRLGLRQR